VLTVLQKTQYINDLETVMMMSGLRVELRLLYVLFSWLPIPAVQEVIGLAKRIDTYGSLAIENLKEHLATSEGQNAATFFTRILSQEKSAISEEEIKEEASNLIIAGSDTTAISLTYTIWALLRPENARVKARLLEEIANVALTAGSKEVGTLSYLSAVVKESLRLYGAAPGSLPRIVPAGGANLEGYHIPGGMTVTTQAYTLHRDPSIFPEPLK